jgi:hypothetical protein
MKLTFLLTILLIYLNVLADENKDEFKIIDEMYRCFNIKKVAINLEYDRIQWSLNEGFTDVCLFSFHVSSNNIYYQYLNRRWRSPLYCKKFMDEWSNLKKEDRKICIAAYLSDPEKIKHKGKDLLKQSGYWEVVKSEKWCHSYFMGNCEGIVNSKVSF